MRCPGRPASGRSRFGVCFSDWRPARPRTYRSSASPLRFFALRIRCGAARRADVSRLLLAIHRTRGTEPAGKWSHAMRRTSSIVRATDRSANPVPITLTHGPSCQAPPLRKIRCLGRVMHRCLSFTRCSATRPNRPSRPGSGVSPSLFQRRSCAPGVHALRRFAPAYRWLSISDQPGPRASSSHTARPDLFSSG